MSIAKTISRTEGADALRAWEVSLCASVVVAIMFGVRVFDHGRFGGWLRPSASVVGGVTIVCLGALIDGIPGYQARNVGAFFLLILWASLVMISLPMATQLGSLVVFWWLVACLCVLAPVLGAGKFASSHPFWAWVWGSVRSARGDIMGPLRQLSLDAKSDQAAARDLGRVVVNAARAIADLDDRDAHSALVEALTHLVATTRGGEPFTRPHHKAADTALTDEVRRAWAAADLRALKAVWERVVIAAGLPPGSTIIGTQVTDRGPVVTVQLTADKPGATVRLDILGQALAAVIGCHVSDLVVEYGANVTVVKVAWTRNRAKPGDWEAAA